MIAKIKTKNSVYNSVVFGILPNGWKTKAIVMDEGNNALQIIDYWKPRRRVFIVDSATDGWVKTSKFEGYDWICARLSKKLFGIKINADDIIDKCREMQSEVTDCEWHCIRGEKDIRDLDELAINFHDAYVTNIDKNDDQTAITFDVWDCKVILELTGDVETNLYVSCGYATTEEGYIDDIFESAMFFEDGYLYWVNACGIHDSKEILKRETSRYFRAKEARWKVII